MLISHTDTQPVAESLASNINIQHLYSTKYYHASQSHAHVALAGNILKIPRILKKILIRHSIVCNIAEIRTPFLSAATLRDAVSRVIPIIQYYLWEFITDGVIIA